MSLLMSVLSKGQKIPTLHTYTFTANTKLKDLFHGRYSRFTTLATDAFGEASFRDNGYGSTGGARFAKYNDYFYSALLLFKETSQEAENALDHLLSLNNGEIQSITLRLDFTSTGSYDNGSIYWDTAASGTVPTSSDDYFTSVHKSDGIRTVSVGRGATSIDINVTEYGIPSSCGWLVHYDRATNLFLYAATLTVTTMEV